MFKFALFLQYFYPKKYGKPSKKRSLQLTLCSFLDRFCRFLHISCQGQNLTYFKVANVQNIELRKYFLHFFLICQMFTLKEDTGKKCAKKKTNRKYITIVETTIGQDVCNLFSLNQIDCLDITGIEYTQQLFFSMNLLVNY